MDALTIVLTVTASESESFGQLAADALANVAALPEFREGSYESGTVFPVVNGVRVQAVYQFAERLAAEGAGA